MGLFDKIKGKVSGEHVDKGVDMVDKKTGGKLGDKSDMIKDKAKDALGVEEENQDEKAQGQGGQQAKGGQGGQGPGQQAQGGQGQQGQGGQGGQGPGQQGQGGQGKGGQGQRGQGDQGQQGQRGKND